MGFSGNRLNARHQTILDYCLAGHRQVDIAKQLNMSASQVHLIVNAPNFQHELAIRRETLQAVKTERLASREDPVVSQLKQGALAAAGALVSSLASENDSIRVKSAGEILDRTGYGRVQKIDASVKCATIMLKSDEAKALTETLNMLKQDAQD